MKGRLYKMDKKKYQSKTLLSEFSHQRVLDEWYDEDSKFSEAVYKLKDGSLILEFDGERFSQYGVAISFNKYIGRKGIMGINYADYCIWKALRKKDKYGNVTTTTTNDPMEEALKMQKYAQYQRAAAVSNGKWRNIIK